jgi:hypothetical protein
MRIDLTRNLQNVMLEIVSNHPSFDSFTIDVDQSSTVISIFRLRLPELIGRSAGDHLSVRKIVMVLVPTSELYTSYLVCRMQFPSCFDRSQSLGFPFSL